MKTKICWAKLNSKIKEIIKKSKKHIYHDNVRFIIKQSVGTSLQIPINNLKMRIEMRMRRVCLWSVQMLSPFVSFAVFIKMPEKNRKDLDEKKLLNHVRHLLEAEQCRCVRAMFRFFRHK